MQIFIVEFQTIRYKVNSIHYSRGTYAVTCNLIGFSILGNGEMQHTYKKYTIRDK